MFGRHSRGIGGGARRSARDLAAASTLYTELLRGTRVRPAGRRTDGARIAFRIGDVLVETGPSAHDGAPVLLHVDEPLEVAERCWDAGFTVRLLDPPFGDAIVSVIDPFGRQVSLVAAACDDRQQAASGE